MSPYEILQVSRNAAADEIKHAYRGALKNIIRNTPSMFLVLAWVVFHIYQAQLIER